MAALYVSGPNRTLTCAALSSAPLWAAIAAEVVHVPEAAPAQQDVEPRAALPLAAAAASC